MKKATKICEGRKCSIAREESDIVSKTLLRLTARTQKMQEIPGSTRAQILIAEWWGNFIFFYIYTRRNLNIWKKIAVRVYEGGRRADRKGKYSYSPHTTVSN